ncbi:hypothetical protein RclHR1_00990010 [Rhizophagus clarus]|uniref:Peptidase S8/S53 domain-containing protein n=1 Tax=Rhizophagus clarus TaxID=94130 RepID=A0A2Z6SQX4_9GLOM|nr:hypothetical protein RclHR1_00990010 [Rhizophagus clarus]GES78753.1 peptidase S8/S53 domain-containing protein [Rhizophagus clarus]
MLTSSLIKIFSIVVLVALSVSAQRECPSIQAEDNNTEKKRFIVIFDKEVKNAAEDHYEMMDFSIDGSIQGYTSYFTTEFAEAVGKMKNVKLVEEEKKIKENAPQRFSRRTEDDDPTPNIDHIDQAKRPLDGKFIYPDSAGEGVNIFIVDSGILLTHDEFNGRAKFGRSFCQDCKRDDIDIHGTFVASIAAGKTVGAARKANIIDVRVLNAKGDGATADMIEGLSFVIDQHKNGKNKNSVINMSVGVHEVSQALNHAVKEVTDAGIHIAVAAGNDSQDACKESPASAISAITVGATESKSDAITDFSNFGKCVAIFAPGRNFFGAGVNSNNDYLVRSGTSFSSPLVAGTLVLLISKSGNKSPVALTDDLKLSTKGVVTGLKKGSPNKFLRTPAP